MPAPMVVMPVTQSIQMQYMADHNKLTASLVGLASLDQRRTVIGNFIYPFVSEILFNQLHIGQNTMLAGKVTGMIISLQEAELMYATGTFETLLSKVREAINLIQASGLLI